MSRRLGGAIDSEAAEEEEMASVVEKALGRCAWFAKEYDRRGIHHQAEAEDGMEGPGSDWIDSDQRHGDCYCYS